MLTPARAMRCAGQPAMSMPSSRIVPALARSSPMISDMTVDLPEPFGPISPTISPARRSKLMFLTATTPPKRLPSSLTCKRTAPVIRARSRCKA